MAAEDVPPVEEEGGARLPGWAQGVRSWVLGHKAQSAFIGGGLLLLAFFFTGGGGSDPAPAGGPESPAPADDRFVACHRYRELALRAATYENRPLYRVNVAG